jgi:phage recombination protein Bet
MSNIATLENQHVEYIEKNLELIANQNKLRGDDLKNFAIQCKRTGLDPITRQIYAIPSGGKLNIMASIDGLRLIAERSGSYEGQTAPQWCGEDGVWKDVWLSKETPKACKLGVYKTKFREPLVAIALFDEYAGKANGKLTFMWAKMPALMIAKVAESLALRKAFPNEMSGIYSSEEMDQAAPEKSQAEKNVDDIKEVMNEVGWSKPSDQPEKEKKSFQKEAAQPSNLGEYVISFGKNKDRKLSDFKPLDLSDYLDNLHNALNKGIDGKPITGKTRQNMIELGDVAEKYLTEQYTKNAVGNVLQGAFPKLNQDDVIPF